ncbi:hypothetical protein C8J57DRAFT_1495105 [Mycena rebaudengoi]|nr:hypothetical protein C8J57DRAFT_1495105 [Mycena rebaudengoi]
MYRRPPSPHPPLCLSYHSPLPHHDAVVHLPARHLHLAPFPRIFRHSRSFFTFYPFRPPKPDTNTPPHRTLADAFPARGLAFPSPPTARSIRRRCTPPRIHPSRGSSSYTSHSAHPSSSLHHSHASHREFHVRAAGAKSPATKKRWDGGHSSGAGWRESGVLRYYETIKVLKCMMKRGLLFRRSALADDEDDGSDSEEVDENHSVKLGWDTVLEDDPDNYDPDYDLNL